MYNVPADTHGAVRIMAVISRSAPRPRRWRILRSALVALALILIAECFVCNLAHWRSIGASTDSASASNALGPGLSRTAQGLLEVRDPAGAYVEVKADGSSDYWRADATPATHVQAVRDGARGDDVVSTVHLRLATRAGDGWSMDSPGVVVSPATPSALLFRAPARGLVRVWIEEPRGTLVPIENFRANVRVPFVFDWARVATMAVAAALVILLLPSTGLWSIALDVSNRRQRLVFAFAAGALGVYVVARSVMIIGYAHPLVFHKDGGYTFDFDQYGHLADALLHGRGSLDLPVPDALARADDPYDAGARARMLTDGVTPIYWDYAFHDGRWYSYFGVLPALVLFAPFRIVTSWFTPGGLMLPTTCAQLWLMAGVTIVACLLVIRLLTLVAPRTSLAAVMLLCVATMLGANLPYLWFRTNFYSIPFSSGLLLAMLGLWLWLGAVRVRDDGGDGGSGGRTLRIVSMPHVAWGALCIAATIGCRPTFTFTALFALPLFLPELRRAVRKRARGRIARLAAALLLPAIVAATPILVYNQLRFTSPFDFGNAYQLTVTDMTRFHTPAGNMPLTVLYYLFLPPRFTGTFPFLALSPTPLPSWSFTEPCVAGLFALMPLALCAFALPWPAVRRRCGVWWPTLVTALALAIVLVVFDAFVGGLGWRYIADFGWLFMVAAVPVVALTMRRWPWTRALVTIVVCASLLLAVASCFVIGRDDMLLTNDPALFHQVRTWFPLL